MLGVWVYPMTAPKLTTARILALLFVIAALIGAGALWNRQRRSTQFVSPRIGPLVEAVYGLGTVVAPWTYQVRTAVNQSVREIFVKEGEQVGKGAPLIQLSDSGTARAPFAGTVTAIPLKKGEILFPSTTALTLISIADLYIEISLEQQIVMRVRSGQPAVVSFESIRGERIRGEVESIFPRETQFIVKVVLDELPRGVLPGMTADVAIEIGRKGDALAIPLKAISSGRVTLRRLGKTVKDAVQIGIVDDQWAEVTSGNIQPTDEILVRAQ